MQWYYSISGQRLGPIPHEELERLIQTGSITGDALVWRQGMDQWKTLDEVRLRDPALFAIAPPPLPGAGEGSSESTPTSYRRPMRLELEEPRPPAPEVLLYAGFWRRAAAFLIDFFLWSFVCQILMRLIMQRFFPDVLELLQTIDQAGPFSYQLSPAEAVVLGRFYGVMALVAVGWAILYDLIFIPRYSATPGKMLLGLKLVRANNKPLGFFRIVARCLAKVLSGVPTLGIGFLLAAIDDQKRGLHDFVCNTRVVTKRKE